MTPRVKRYSRLLRKVPLLMVAELTVLLVRMYTELSNAQYLDDGFNNTVNLIHSGTNFPAGRKQQW